MCWHDKILHKCGGQLSYLLPVLAYVYPSEQTGCMFMPTGQEEAMSSSDSDSSSSNAALKRQRKL